MENGQFFEAYSALAEIFDRKPKVEVGNQWFAEFGWLDDIQWKQVAAVLKRECEKFPVPAQVHRAIASLGFDRGKRLIYGPSDPLIVVECPSKFPRRDNEGRDLYTLVCSNKHCYHHWFEPEIPLLCPRCRNETVISRGIDTLVCGGSFAAYLTEINAAAESAELWPCPNSTFGCKMTFTPHHLLKLFKTTPCKDLIRREHFAV